MGGPDEPGDNNSILASRSVNVREKLVGYVPSVGLDSHGARTRRSHLERRLMIYTVSTFVIESQICFCYEHWDMQVTNHRLESLRV